MHHVRWSGTESTHSFKDESSAICCSASRPRGILVFCMEY
jgi:hypothetical protein